MRKTERVKGRKRERQVAKSNGPEANTDSLPALPPASFSSQVDSIHEKLENG